MPTPGVEAVRVHCCPLPTHPLMWCYPAGAADLSCHESARLPFWDPGIFSQVESHWEVQWAEATDTHSRLVRPSTHAWCDLPGTYTGQCHPRLLSKGTKGGWGEGRA